MSSQSSLHFNIAIDGLTDSTLVVTEFDGEEGLSIPFSYRIKLASELTDITADQTVDRNAILTLWQQGEEKRHIHGIVRRFRQGSSGHHHSYYEIELVPALSRLQLRHNCRIFQEQTPIAIISTLLDEMGIDDYAFVITGPTATREYCVQYSESDLDFISRLAAEEGIFYSFTHNADSHTVIFSDSTFHLANLSNSLPYNAVSGGLAETPYIYDWFYRSEVKPSSVQLKDYSFKSPAYGFESDAEGTDMNYQHGTYEHYDYPGRYKSSERGLVFAGVRLEYLRREALAAEAKSNITEVYTGSRFDLSDHTDDIMNRDWSVIRLSCQGTQPQALQEYGNQGATTYNNQFICIPGDRPWRPAPVTKPMVYGPQIATVTGPSGEEIYCDEFGRVKVLFPWDREGTSDDSSSCWVRVSQGWAGAGYGLFALPRIGHEVIVSFLEGDPDQPIITGRTFHASNLSPYNLPENKTITVLKTQSHQTDGSNELRFEDAGGQEEIYIHAQKDQNIVVENEENTEVKVNRSHTIGENDTLSIGNNQSVSIGSNQDISVDKNRNISVTKDETVSVSGSRNHTITKDDSLTVDANRIESVTKDKTLSISEDYKVTVSKKKTETINEDSTLSVGKNFAIDVGDAFAIVCGDSKFSMKKDGTIILEGKKVKIDGKTQTEVGSKKVKIEGSSQVQIKGNKVGNN